MRTDTGDGGVEARHHLVIAAAVGVMQPRGAAVGCRHKLRWRSGQQVQEFVSREQVHRRIMPRHLFVGAAAGLALVWRLHPRHRGGLEGPGYPPVEAPVVALRYRPATLVAPPGRFSATWKSGAEASA